MNHPGCSPISDDVAPHRSVACWPATLRDCRRDHHRTWHDHSTWCLKMEDLPVIYGILWPFLRGKWWEWWEKHGILGQTHFETASDLTGVEFLADGLWQSPTCSSTCQQTVVGTAQLWFNKSEIGDLLHIPGFYHWFTASNRSKGYSYPKKHVGFPCHHVVCTLEVL